MESTRSFSVSSLNNPSGDDVELHDHRLQPHGLPGPRTSISEMRNPRLSLESDEDAADSSGPDDVLADRTDEPISNYGIDPILSGRRRTLSESTPRPPRRERAVSQSSCAVSEHSVNSLENAVEGILLNRSKSSARRSIDERRRRMTRSSVISGQDEDTGSRLSFGGDDEEDVCFPPPATSEATGIDFEELDMFAKFHRNDIDINDRQLYKPVVPASRIQGHRPLVPPGLGMQRTNHSDSTRTSRNGDEYLEKVSSRGQGPYSMQQNVDDDDDDGEFAKSYTRAHQAASYTTDRYSFFAAESYETIHSPDLACLVEPNQSFRDLFNSKNGTWWLDVMDPTDAEMKVLSKAFGIHPLTAEDIKTQEAREKVELFKDYYFVCFHTFEADAESVDFLDSVNMHMVVFKDGVLSFHFDPVTHTANVRRRIRQLQDYVSVSSDWICYALIDDITDSFAPIIREIEIEADVIEDSVFVAREADFSFMLKRIGLARKKVMSLMRLIFGKADVIKMFAKRCNERWDNAPRGEIGLYLGDIQDHIITMYQNLQVYEKIFSRSHGNYLAQLQVESVASNNRVTKVLGRVTMIGTVLVPLNLITGLFGMNVKVPGQDGSNLGWFFGIIGVMITVVVVLSYIARLWIGEAEKEEAERATTGARSVLNKGVNFARTITNKSRRD